MTPTPPPFDLEELERRPYLERIRAMAEDWALNGFGTPVAVYLLYVVKIAIYAVGGLLLISATTDGIGGLGDIGSWWTEPIVFQKVVVWTMLWEVLGLGAGSLPLTLRFSPLIGGVLYWLRPGTTRLPPWPDRVPLTRGTRRTVLDVAIYAGLIASLLYLLIDGETGAVPETALLNLVVVDGSSFAGWLDPTTVGVALGFLVALGLRDKVSFLAARPEIYGTLMLIFLFPLENMIVAAQLVFVCIWWGAAASKLNRHFPFVVTVMISNTPWNRSRAAKRRLYRDHPRDLLPSRLGAAAAHCGTVLEFALPALLLITQGGWLGTIAVASMIVFHVHIFSTFPLAVPLEWNVFMIFGLFFLFGHYGDTSWSTVQDPLLLAILALVCVGLPVLGNFRPDLVSFLPSMRYYAGNWATSQWLFSREAAAESKLDREIEKPAPIVVEQLRKLYGEDMVRALLVKGLAFRSMHSHGRALNALALQAVDEIEAYEVRDGEIVAGVVLGYNFGDGHFHQEQLLAAVQERCRFKPGELRVVALESQPAHDPRQRYRILDAADGVIEEGWVDVREMVRRQPWEPAPLHPDPHPQAR